MFVNSVSTAYNCALVLLEGFRTRTFANLKVGGRLTRSCRQAVQKVLIHTEKTKPRFPPPDLTNCPFSLSFSAEGRPRDPSHHRRLRSLSSSPFCSNRKRLRKLQESSDPHLTSRISQQEHSFLCNNNNNKQQTTAQHSQNSTRTEFTLPSEQIILKPSPASK